MSPHDSSQPDENGNIPDAPSPSQTATTDDPAAALGVLLSQAEEARQMLWDLLARTGEVESRTAQASIDLQDRLRLGARMLQAFQAQIDQAHTAVDTMGEHESPAAGAPEDLEKQISDKVGERAEAIDSRVEETLTRFESHLESLIDQKLQQFSQAAAPPDQNVDELQQRLNDTQARVGQLESELNETRQKFAESAAQSGPGADQLQQRLNEVEARTGQLEGQLNETRQLVSESASKPAANVDEFQQRLNDTQARIGQLEGQLNETRQQVSESASQPATNVDEIQQRLTETQARIGELESQLNVTRQQVADNAGRPDEGSDQAEHRLNELQGAVDQLRNRLEETIQQAAEGGSQSSPGVDDADQRLNDLLTRTEELEKRLETAEVDGAAASHKSTQAVEAVERATQQINDVVHRTEQDNKLAEAAVSGVEETSQQCEQTKADLRQAAAEMEELIDRCAKVYAETESALEQRSPDAESPQASEELRQLHDRLDKAGERAAVQVREVRGIIRQSEDARRMLGEELLRTIEQLDSIADQRLEIRRTIESVAGYPEDSSAGEQRAAGDGGSRQLQEVRNATAALDRVIEQLEPWRSILLADGAGPADLPAPVTRLMTTLQEQLAEDAGRLLSAIDDAAHTIRGALPSSADSNPTSALPHLSGPDGADEYPAAAD